MSFHDRAYEELRKLLDVIEVGGFWGTATLTLVVQNGNIEQIRVATDKVMK